MTCLYELWNARKTEHSRTNAGKKIYESATRNVALLFRISHHMRTSQSFLQNIPEKIVRPRSYYFRALSTHHVVLALNNQQLAR